MRKLNVLTKIFIKKKAFQSTMDERDDDREKYESQEEVVNICFMAIDN